MIESQKTKLQNTAGTIAEVLAAFMTALLSVKFASMVSVPEMPASYWFDPISLLFVVWPIHLFSFLSAILLLFSAFAHGLHSFRNRHAACWIVLWILLAFLSFSGVIHASCREYSLQMIAYTFGTGAFAASVFLLLDRRQDFSKILYGALMCGAVLSAISGLNQYFHGFDDLEKYLAEQQEKYGEAAVNIRLLIRVRERRLQGDFPSCNTYGGYLVMLLPVLFYGLWKFGATRVQPEKWSCWILSLPVLPIYFFLIVMTRSRGAFFSFCLAIVFLCFSLPIGRKIKLTILVLFALIFDAFLFVTINGRGFGSMIFRFDYNWAAARMMVSYPLFGTGWGDFFHDYQWMKLLINDEAPHTPHNMFFLFGSQCGIPSFLAACAFLFFPLVYAVRMVRKCTFEKKNFLLPILLFSISSAFVDFMLEVTYEDPAFLCSFAIIVMLFFYAEKTDSPMPKTLVPNKTGKLILRVTVFLFVLFTGSFSWHMMRSEKAFAEFQELLDPRSARNVIQADTHFIPPTPDVMMTALKRTTELGPYNPFPWASAAGYMISAGDPASAMDLIGEAIKRSPQRASFYVRRAEILNMMHADPALIKADLTKARSLFPMSETYRMSDKHMLGNWSNR